MHTAAVTCIADLLDGTHLATASYDRKIAVFDYRKGAAVFSVVGGRTGIGCMGVTVDKLRIITSSLDKVISIWRIQR